MFTSIEKWDIKISPSMNYFLNELSVIDKSIAGIFIVNDKGVADSFMLLDMNTTTYEISDCDKNAIIDKFPDCKEVVLFFRFTSYNSKSMIDLCNMFMCKLEDNILLNGCICVKMKDSTYGKVVFVDGEQYINSNTQLKVCDYDSEKYLYDLKVKLGIIKIKNTTTSVTVASDTKDEKNKINDVMKTIDKSMLDVI